MNLENPEGSWQEVQLLSDAIKYQPNVAFLYYDRAEQYQRLDKIPAAIRDYKTCVILDWEFARLYYELAKCELELQAYEAAYTDFTIALALSEQEWKDAPAKMKTPNHWGDPTGEHQEFVKEIRLSADFAKSRMTFKRDDPCSVSGPHPHPKSLFHPRSD